MGSFVNFKWKGSNKKGLKHKTCLICGERFMGKSDDDTCGSDQCEYAYSRLQIVRKMNGGKK